MTNKKPTMMRIDRDLLEEINICKIVPDEG